MKHIVTIIITTLYSYISIYSIDKTSADAQATAYNNQYRYNYIYSIIRIIPNNTDMNNHTVYT